MDKSGKLLLHTTSTQRLCMYKATIYELSVIQHRQYIWIRIIQNSNTLTLPTTTQRVHRDKTSNIRALTTTTTTQSVRMYNTSTIESLSTTTQTESMDSTTYTSTHYYGTKTSFT